MGTWFSAEGSSDFVGEKSGIFVIENGLSVSNLPSANKFLTQLSTWSTIDENDTFSGEISKGLISEFLEELAYTPSCGLDF